MCSYILGKLHIKAMLQLQHRLNTAQDGNIQYIIDLNRYVYLLLLKY